MNIIDCRSSRAGPEILKVMPKEKQSLLALPYLLMCFTVSLTHRKIAFSEPECGNVNNARSPSSTSNKPPKTPSKYQKHMYSSPCRSRQDLAIRQSSRLKWNHLIKIGGESAVS